jgi:hypothetical protein
MSSSTSVLASEEEPDPGNAPKKAILTVTLTARRTTEVSADKEFFEVLEIDSTRLRQAERPAADYCALRWQELGRPRDAEALGKFLDDVISFCPTVGLRYPKVLLKRLKQVQRGEWRPVGGTREF